MEFYRYTWQTYAEIDWDGDYVRPNFPNPKLNVSTYEMVRETPKGYWISPKGFNSYKNFHKWISKTSRRRYAYPTQEEALNNFILRTSKRVEILAWELDCCKIAVDMAKSISAKEIKTEEKCILT